MENIGRDVITGVWELLAFEDRESEAESWNPTFGQDPRGVVVYHPSGLLSVQVLAGSGDAWAPYLGYVGRWSLREISLTADGAEGVVEHRMESASMLELLDEDPARPFVVAGDELVLGDSRTYRRIFRRPLPPDAQQRSRDIRTHWE